MMLALSKNQISRVFHGHVEGDRVDAALETLAASPYESGWELEIDLESALRAWVRFAVHCRTHTHPLAPA